MTTQTEAILLKNGVALIHDSANHVVPTQTDLLLENGRISKIGKDITAPSGARVIDCSDKIISPGFIDTHHHSWQTQLKGRHANEQLIPYMMTGNAQSFQYTPKDIFYGSLAASLETLSAGTTTLLDHAHTTYTPDHAHAGISALVSSGIRAVYCYTPIIRMKSLVPLDFNGGFPLEDWVVQTFTDLAASSPFGSGRVSLGFAFDLFFLGAQVVKPLFEKVKAAGVKTITVHGSTALNDIVRTLQDFDLLDEHILISHGGNVSSANAEAIKAAGAHLSSTPSTELQMGNGRPYAFDEAFADKGWSGDQVGLQSVASLGIDCQSCTAGSIVSEARLGLQNARNHYNEHQLRQGKTPVTIPESLSVEAAFNLATVQGAKAVRMESEIGRIAEGFRADLVVFDALGPSMLAAAQHDAVAAVILHSSPADVEMVIVDGVVRKEDGKLVPVHVDGGARGLVEKETLVWGDVAKEVLSSRERMQVDIEKIDFVEAQKALLELWHVDASKLV